LAGVLAAPPAALHSGFTPGTRVQRYTRQRNSILNALVAAQRPLGPQEILDAAREDTSTLGIATVYRTIALLLEDGAIRAVSLPGDAPRYEAADLGHHHHFKCEACERVFDVNACVEDLVKLVPRGFVLQGHEVTLYGRCAECAGRRAPARKPRGGYHTASKAARTRGAHSGATSGER
jgi:Fur family ferric uptake transcriptional regulator